MAFHMSKTGKKMKQAKNIYISIHMINNLWWEGDVYIHANNNTII